MEATRTVRIRVKNLGCGEANVLEGELAEISGVLRAYVNPASETAYFEYDPRRTDPGALLRAVRRAGYRAGPPAG
jgi:copper chaperone CopZ